MLPQFLPGQQPQLSCTLMSVQTVLGSDGVMRAHYANNFRKAIVAVSVIIFTSQSLAACMALPVHWSFIVTMREFVCVVQESEMLLAALHLLCRPLVSKVLTGNVS